MYVGSLDTPSENIDLNKLSCYEEIFDAMALLSLLAARAHRLDRASEQAQYLSLEAEKLERLLKAHDQWKIQIEMIGAKTSIDIRNYAAHLLNPEFKE